MKRHTLTVTDDADGVLAFCSCQRWSYATTDGEAAEDAHRSHLWEVDA